MAVGIDIGGTNTDAAIVGDGEVRTFKVSHGLDKTHYLCDQMGRSHVLL